MALADLLAVWVVLPLEFLRGSTADSCSLPLRRVEQPESTYGSTGAAYGRLLESLHDGVNELRPTPWRVIHGICKLPVAAWLQPPGSELGTELNPDAGRVLTPATEAWVGRKPQRGSVSVLVLFNSGTPQ
jgi:hypothetical protein